MRIHPPPQENNQLLSKSAEATENKIWDHLWANLI